MEDNKYFDFFLDILQKVDISLLTGNRTNKISEYIKALSCFIKLSDNDYNYNIPYLSEKNLLFIKCIKNMKNKHSKAEKIRKIIINTQCFKNIISSETTLGEIIINDFFKIKLEKSLPISIIENANVNAFCLDKISLKCQVEINNMIGIFSSVESTLNFIEKRINN